MRNYKTIVLNNVKFNKNKNQLFDHRSRYNIS